VSACECGGGREGAKNPTLSLRTALRRGDGSDLRLRLSPAQAAHNDSVQANKSIQGRMFEGQTPDKAVTTAYNPTAMLY
jgi:hypothetical protein